jgi:hypothetical protein
MMRLSELGPSLTRHDFSRDDPRFRMLAARQGAP